MNVIFVLPKLGLGGAENVLSTYVAFAESQEWNVQTVFYSDLAGVDSGNLFSLKVFSVLRKLRTLHLLARENPDAYFITTLLHQNISLCFLKALGLIRNKVIIRETNNYVQQVRNKNSLDLLIYLMLRKVLYSQADTIIILNKNMMRMMNDVWFLSSDKVIVVPNPIRENLLQGEGEHRYADDLKTREISQFCGKKPLSGKVYYSVGSLIEQKNFSLLIKVFAADAFENDRLVIFGDGYQKRKLEALVDELGIQDRVLFAGAFANYGSLHQYLDIFVSTSRYEGSPNAMSEALALGKFCISGDYEYGPRDLLRNESYGILFDPESEESLLQALIAGKSKAKECLADKAVRDLIKEWNGKSRSEFVRAITQSAS